ncbi:MAG: hypothetical protein V4550_15440 [Gemmatimonadota bacterium]
MSKVKKMAMRATVRNVRRISRPKGSVDDGRRFDVRPLDPQQMCGARTSVECLLRVTERQEGLVHHHLVYFDRHGWYCDHGPACPAVFAARRSLRR